MNSELSRRQMLLMSALTVAAFTPVARALGAAAATTTVDAGAVGDYAKDGVYDQFRSNRLSPVPRPAFCARSGLP